MRVFVFIFFGLLRVQACTSKNSSSEVSENVTSEESIPEGLQLIQGNDCQACHHKKNTLIGPSYSAIAKKYEEDEATLALLSSKVIKGGTGVWGDVPMTAHPTLSEEEARKMIRYILTVESITQ